MPSVPISGSATLTNSVGLHARPAVKLTTLAKQFAASVELSKAVEGPWFDAKSPVKVMRLKALKGTTLFFRATGGDAGNAVAALIALVNDRFGEAEDFPNETATHEPGDG